MTENVQIDETAGTDVNDALVTEYTSESEGPVAGEAARRPSASAPGAATGRRKQAIARVRIVPGASSDSRPVTYMETNSPAEDCMKVRPRSPSAAMSIDGK